ncbi:TPA: StfH/YfcO family fimbrial adhesin, partial [Escherichia coli]
STHTTKIVYYLDVLTPESVNHGSYKPPDGYGVITGWMDKISWTGSGTAPSLKIISLTKIGKSSCPGLDEFDSRSGYSDWTCYEARIEVWKEDSSVHGCPWLVSTHADSRLPLDPGPGTYSGPTVSNSSCPPIPLGPYDVSWNESRVVRDKTLTLQSTGGIIEKTLSTYLMKDGKLCDGSKFGDTDDRGAYCRWVSQMLTFTSSGCDNAKVTVTPNRHPVTDKELHDMVLRVDTTSRQPIDSTCRFQYVLNML